MDELHSNSYQDSSSDESDKEKYQKIKDSIKNKDKKPKNFGKTLKQLIHKSSKTKNVILSKVKEPFQKLDEEKEKRKTLNIKREKRKEQKLLGYTLYKDFDKKLEKRLLKTTTKGVVKLFNSIFEFRKKAKEDQIKEEQKIEKKSSNFLMMHNLNQDINPKFKKQFKEDTEINDNKKPTNEI